MKGPEDSQNKAAIWVEKLILDFWETSDNNTLNNGTGEMAWEKPLVAFASGDDSLFGQFKNDLQPLTWLPGQFQQPSYWLPEEAWQLKFPEEKVSAPELSVIVWILPQTSETCCDQKLEKKTPAERWARSRDFGEKFNCALRLHLADKLTEAGFPAVAPDRLPNFGYQRSEVYGITSNWSERHAAYVAGLGTFGLSAGLITPKGKAVRIGSVVAKIDLHPTKRPYTDFQQWCLWYSKRKCGACIRRCPSRAITPVGHDKDICFNYMRTVTAPYSQATFGTDATPCGLCQVNVPCEKRIPL